jgi:ABC-2 type transport system ATP-binding protein
MSGGGAILEVDGLVKRYGRFCAVDGISFEVPRGAVVGLLGPNGAGKTTTVQMLTGVTLPDGGAIRYFGLDLARHRQACLQRINFASSFNTLQTRISVRENLLVFAQLYRVPQAAARIARLAEGLDSTELLGQRFLTLSAGQKTRVNLIKSLLNDPELVLMDEPTASLDPDIADRTLTLIERLRAERELSILYTSHEMDEVTRLCDEVIFLDRGRIVARGTPRELTARLATARLRLTLADERARVEAALAGQPHPARLLEGGAATAGRCVAELDLPEAAVPQALFGLRDAGLGIVDIDLRKPTLEDVFLQISRGGRVA